jgi:hypothetical protein
LKSVFPSDRDEREEINNGLSDLSIQLSRMMQSVKELDSLNEKLSRIPVLSRLIITDIINANPLKPVKPDSNITDPIDYSRARYNKHVKDLDDINHFLSMNPLVTHDVTLINKLKDVLKIAFERGQFERKIRDIIIEKINEIDNEQDKENREVTTKRKQFEEVLDAIREYSKSQSTFYDALAKIASHKIKISTKKIESMGHKLYIDNEFELTQKMFVEVVNGMLKKEYTITDFKNISPSALFDYRFSGRNPKVKDYEDFSVKVKQKFEDLNKKTYRIITKEGRNFENLSAGWKTSVILDLILGWESDNATLIIDQPEDNLATNYINHGLLSAIKKCKSKKQIILVTHNATIPMLGDAQNVVICKNDGSNISIRSDALEGNIYDQRVLDHIVKITDGGKASVKKRVKKYNLKNYREDES